MVNANKGPSLTWWATVEIHEGTLHNIYTCQFPLKGPTCAVADRAFGSCDAVAFTTLSRDNVMNAVYGVRISEGESRTKVAKMARDI